jgi:thiosulfate dehydrogenase
VIHAARCTGAERKFIGGRFLRTIILEIFIALAAVAGFGAGYLLWDKMANYYAADISTLGPGPENDLIRYGQELIVNTPRYIGKSAENPEMAYAGNDLACQSCHLKAGLQPYAAPFVSTAATFPMMVNNEVITLPGRINGCMELSMNGHDLPEDSREMEALIAYIKFLGKGTPEGVRLPGMGLMPIALPAVAPDARRGAEVYAQHCAGCHGADGQGQPKPSPQIGYAVPPLWGDGSYNGGAGMGQIAYAASFIRSNMPPGSTVQAPTLKVQQAWDVAAYMNAQPHPLAPPDKIKVPPVSADEAAPEAGDAAPN